jgi:predicted aconitase with swiveling domain
VTAELRGAVLVPGRAAGPILALAEPLSFWGGVDPATGRIIEARHPDHGRSVAGHVLALPAVRGSSSSSSILAELLRVGLGPRGILLGEPDEILVVGAVVARELYGTDCPVLLLDAAAYGTAAAWTSATIEPDGTISGDWIPRSRGPGAIWRRDS